jgi:methylmalonyl-CoA/ethylmalonyl-CoA epimerase
MITTIDHLGIAVRSLDESVEYYERVLGLKCEHREEVDAQKVRTAFFNVGGVHIELLEPTSPESAVAKFLDKNGEGLHHLAFASNDIHAQLSQAAQAGCRLINDKPLVGAGGKLVAFLHPKSTHGVLTEICSSKPETIPAS